MKFYLKYIIIFSIVLLSGCTFLNERKLENHRWQVALDDSLIYQVDFQDELVHFQLDEDNFMQQAEQELDLSLQETKDLLNNKKEELNFTARYYLEGNYLNLIQSMHQAKQYEIKFEGTTATLTSSDGSQLILERVE
ncbi:hypothetical protein [Facklamia sp. 7083-14-GEN3]|uniref:hypothetical protein n=1 Tax=Facklamia sp. 7083-14-GEN3 TaxID=2973478 RepID=UPI00215D36BE|nr:hypothetical protein [Facklamia sp. 7083-14-GEN3]MCR8969224.1 hypothetical protein [Facklamia sp. 7083-14-GEN3]